MSSIKVIIMFFFSIGVPGILSLLLFTLRTMIPLTLLPLLQFSTYPYMSSSQILFLHLLR